MKKKTAAIVLTVIAAVTATAGILGAVVLATPGRGDVPMSRPSGMPTSVPVSTEKSTATPPRMADIAGIPTHITILHGNEPLVDAAVVPIALDYQGILAPPPGQAGVYFSQADWNTIPGNLDRYRGIIAGHDVTGSGAKDVFYNLGEVKQGDQILLTYQLDAGGVATAVFEASADAVSAQKSDVIHADAYRYLWQPKAEAGRYLSIFSCDLSQADPGQHSRNNWVVDAVRRG